MGDQQQADGTAYVQILEQPSPKSLRFRYECEGRSTGALSGSRSTNDKKTFPKIQVVGYNGRAVVVVSCVTIDKPYRPHPHNLVGKDGFCKKGVCTMEIASDDMTCEFPNLGIQCVKKKDIEDSLKIRKEIRVDPFRTGFDHATQNSGSGIDLNSLRLCFQVFLEGPEPGEFKIPVKAIVSDPIFDKKSVNDLTVVKLSDCTSPVIGNKEIILLCDKISKDDIEVRFYEEAPDGNVVWESFGNFQPSVDVWKQFAISFRTPQYRDLEITNPVRVFLQLRCPSKGTTSAPRPFEYIPLCSGRKRLWNLTSFTKCNMADSMMSSSASMIKSHDSAISEPPKKITKSLVLEDLLVAEGAEDSLYKDLNDVVSGGFSKSIDLDFNMLLGEGPGDDALGLGNGDMDIMMMTSDGVPDVSSGLDGTGDMDTTYSSFMLAMRNPIDFELETGSDDLASIIQPPPRPPKSLLIGGGVDPPPPLPPRRQTKVDKKQSGGGLLSKIFGGSKSPTKSPKKASPQQSSPGSKVNLNTNKNGLAVKEGGLVLFDQLSARGSDVDSSAISLETPLSPTTSLLKSLIKDEQNEHLFKQNNNESTPGDLNDLDIENYALLYVDTSAPRATSSEFDESSNYYVDSTDLVNNN